MTAKQTMKWFKELFPYLESDVASYKANKEKGGIDITMINGMGNESVFNFKFETRTSWTLKRVR